MQHSLKTLVSKGLTGKEVVAMIARTFLDRYTGDPASFSDAELDRASASINRNRYECRSYNEWIKILHIMVYLQNQARISALDAALKLHLRISLLFMATISPPRIEKDSGLDDVKACIARFIRIRQVLQVFSDNLGVEFTGLTKYEEWHMNHALALYNHFSQIGEEVESFEPEGSEDKELQEFLRNMKLRKINADDLAASKEEMDKIRQCLSDPLNHNWRTVVDECIAS